MTGWLCDVGGTELAFAVSGIIGLVAVGATTLSRLVAFADGHPPPRRAATARLVHWGLRGRRSHRVRKSPGVSEIVGVGPTQRVDGIGAHKDNVAHFVSFSGRSFQGVVHLRGGSLIRERPERHPPFRRGNLKDDQRSGLRNESAFHTFECDRVAAEPFDNPETTGQFPKFLLPLKWVAWCPRDQGPIFQHCKLGAHEHRRAIDF